MSNLIFKDGGEFQVKQITINVENKPGEVYRVCDALGKRGINITSLFGSGGGRFIKLLTEDEKSTIKALEQAGFKASSDDILIIKIPDKAGELAKVMAKLAFARINVNSLYLITREKDKAVLGVEVDDLEKAKKLL
ncbi:MAG: hypothetical protein QXO69_00565 [archaeon]